MLDIKVCEFRDISWTEAGGIRNTCFKKWVSLHSGVQKKKNSRKLGSEDSNVWQNCSY